MKNCKACKKEIDSTATKCPYCQTDQRGWRSRHKILTAIIGIIGVLLLISVVAARNGNNNTKTSSDSNTPEKVASSWNTEELDIAKNGNIAVAVNLLKGLTSTGIKDKAETPDPATVMKTPWKYYGKIVKMQGEVGIVQDYPPGGDIAKALGGEGSEIVFVTEDGTPVDYAHMGSTGDVKVGDTVIIYGYPVGQVEVDNQIGGKTTQLVVVGKTVEQVAP